MLWVVNTMPSGTVTFLFTDIESSTSLWDSEPHSMSDALRAHDALLRAAIDRSGGYIFSTAGDGIGAAFSLADEALGAAIAAQSAIASEAWPTTAPLRVRMGIHSGPAEERGGDYFGPSVNRAARVMALARGMQILVSLASREAFSGPDVSFVDCGEHRLKGFADPERIFTVSGPGLDDGPPSGSSRRVRCQVLGSLAIDGVAVRSPSQRRVLACLVAAHGRGITLNRLVDAVWDDAPPASATNALQSYVSRLRAALGTDAILWQPTGYQLALSVDDVDAWTFEAAVVEARNRAPQAALRLYDEALGLWHGSPFAELCDAPCNIGETVRLGELHAEALQRRLECLLRLGHGDVVVTETAALVEADPYREAIWSLRMRALHAEGRTVEAVRAYHQFRSLLADTLGLEPSADLAALERVLVCGTPPAAPDMGVARSGNLPIPVTRMIGRDESCHELAKRLEEDRLVTLVGPGGVGKSRLAIAVAHEFAKRTSTLAWFVELDATDADAVARVTARVLGLVDDAGPVAGICRVLAAGPALVVLDNCEHVAGAVAGLLRAVLPECATTRVLVTSRARLGVPGEVVWRVPPLSLPPSAGVDDLDELSTHSGTRLFLDRLAQLQVSIGDEPATVRAIAAICRAVDGLPLGIELAAGMAGELPLGRIAHGLLPPASVGVATSGADRHGSLTAAVAWSYDLLQPAAQRLCRRLSIFEGGWVLETAELVVGAGGPETSDVAGLHADLARASMIVFDPSAQRYSMLATIRAFARARLDELGETAALADAHLAWCRRLAAAAAESQLGRYAQPEMLRALEREDANLRAAVRWGLGEPARHNEAASLLCDLNEYWSLVGSSPDVVVWIRQVLRSPVTVRHRIELLLDLGEHLSHLGDSSGGRAAGVSALALARRLDNPNLLCRCLIEVASSDDGEQGVALAEEAGRIAAALGDADLGAEALGLLGFLAWRHGRCHEAVDHLEAARRCGTTRASSGTAFFLALARAAQGCWAEAREAAMASEREAADRGDRLGASRTCLELARVDLCLGDVDAASRALERADEWNGRPTDDYPAEQMLFDAISAALEVPDGDRGAGATATKIATSPVDTSPRGTICEAWLLAGATLLRRADWEPARTAFCNVLRHRAGQWPFNRADALHGIALTLAPTGRPHVAAVLRITADAIRARHALTPHPLLIRDEGSPPTSDAAALLSEDDAVALALRFE
jgi:predicted ATPase/class 3 adenylate cyclase/DNA-binding SARP family transcriptional activator